MNCLPGRTGVAFRYLRDGCPLINLTPAVGEAVITGDECRRHSSCSQPLGGSAAAVGSTFHPHLHIRSLLLYLRILLFP